MENAICEFDICVSCFAFFRFCHFHAFHFVCAAEHMHTYYLWHRNERTLMHLAVLCRIHRNIKQFIRCWVKTQSHMVRFWWVFECRLPSIPHILLRTTLWSVPHFSRLRVKQKYGSEFEIKRETDSCWIIWPKRTKCGCNELTNTITHAHTHTRRHREGKREQTLHANWIAAHWISISGFISTHSQKV